MGRWLEHLPNDALPPDAAEQIRRGGAAVLVPARTSRQVFDLHGGQCYVSSPVAIRELLERHNALRRAKRP
jgi:hypothetical protein